MDDTTLGVFEGIATGLEKATNNYMRAQENLFNISAAKEKLTMAMEDHKLDKKIRDLQIQKLEREASPEEIERMRKLEDLKAKQTETNINYYMELTNAAKSRAATAAEKAKREAEIFGELRKKPDFLDHVTFNAYGMGYKTNTPKAAGPGFAASNVFKVASDMAKEKKAASRDWTELTTEEIRSMIPAAQKMLVEAGTPSQTQEAPMASPEMGDAEEQSPIDYDALSEDDLYDLVKSGDVNAVRAGKKRFGSAKNA